jgi:hypothetical protein
MLDPCPWPKASLGDIMSFDNDLAELKFGHSRNMWLTERVHWHASHSGAGSLLNKKE